MKYYRAFADQLKEHMRAGYSYDTFFATIEVPRDVVDGWLETELDFAAAKHLGEGLRKQTLQRLLLSKAITLDVYESLTQDTEGAELDDELIEQARARFA